MTAKATKATPKKADTPSLPEVRQNQDPESASYGSSAQAGQGRQSGLWLVGHGEHGAHWAEPDEVEDWKVMS